MTDKRKSNIARFIEKRVDDLVSKKSQKDIAAEAGFANPNVLVMFKQGRTKVPLDRVIQLARALEIEPSFLFNLALEQFYGDGSNPVAEIFNDIIPNKMEAKLIRALREFGLPEKNGASPPAPEDKALHYAIVAVQELLFAREARLVGCPLHTE